MREYHALLESITLSLDGQTAARLSCKSENIPAPGQMVLACKPGDRQALRKCLFPSYLLQSGFVADSPPEPNWRVGDALNLWGPIGKGYTPPAGSKKWLLASFQYPPQRLFALIQWGLERGAAISLCCHPMPAQLPPQVEWIANVTEAISWADYLALDLPWESISTLRARLGLPLDEQLPIHAQILVTQPVPCGLGLCYVCAVKARQGHLLSCTDGPVFQLNQLEL